MVSSTYLFLLCVFIWRCQNAFLRMCCFWVVQVPLQIILILIRQQVTMETMTCVTPCDFDCCIQEKTPTFSATGDYLSAAMWLVVFNAVVHVDLSLTVSQIFSNICVLRGYYSFFSLFFFFKKRRNPLIYCKVSVSVVIYRN